MYAIVEIAGQQYKVQKDQQVYVHRLEGEEGSKLELDNVLLIDDDGKISVGAPALEGALISATILKHLKGDKVTVFKKKRRKGYKVRNGHRQYLSQIQIEEIAAKGAKKTAKKAEEQAKPKAEKAEETKASAPKAAPAPKKEAKAEKKEVSTEAKTEKKEAKTKTSPKEAAKKPEKKETKEVKAESKSKESASNTTDKKTSGNTEESKGE